MAALAAAIPVVAALEVADAQAAVASEVADKYALKGFAICQHALKEQKLLAQGIALGNHRHAHLAL